MSFSPSSAPTRRDRRDAARRSRRRPALIATGVVLGLVATASVTGTAASYAAEPEPEVTPVADHQMALASYALPSPATESTALEGARSAAETTLAAAAAVTGDIASAGVDLGLPDTTIDTGALEAATIRLDKAGILPDVLHSEIADDVTEVAGAVDARVAELRGSLEGALARKAAEEAAAAEAARKEAEAEAAAKAARSTATRSTGSGSGSATAFTGGGSGDNSPAGAQATARSMLAQRGWGDDQFQCLVSLWNKESGWNYQASNRSSGAYGIPQALPGSKMASAGADWQTNAATQVAWGLGYISGRYGTPCGAWSHSQSTGWY